MKRVAQAVSLAVALLSAPAAYAQVFADWGVHDQQEYVQTPLLESGLFAHNYTFVLPENNNLYAVAVSNNLFEDNHITNGRIGLWSGTPGDQVWLGAFNEYDFDGDTGHTVRSFTGLTGGDYFYRVSGEAIGTSTVAGLYSLSSVLAPIPEPEIYAMMGIGLGFMGWIVRRRKLQVA